MSRERFLLRHPVSPLFSHPFPLIPSGSTNQIRNNMNKSFRNILGLFALALSVLFVPSVATAAINDQTVKSVTCHGDPATDRAIDEAYAMGAITWAQWFAYHTYGIIPGQEGSSEN